MTQLSLFNLANTCESNTHTHTHEYSLQDNTFVIRTKWNF